MAAVEAALLQFYRSLEAIERFRSMISFRNEFFRLREVLIFNLDWTLGGVQC